MNDRKKNAPVITPIPNVVNYDAPSNNDRQPRWSKWKLMPEVKLWEAVALSLNIEPGKIETNELAWMGAKHPFDEDDEFNDRLTVLSKHSSNRAFFPTPCILNMANWYQCEVRLNEFAAWCAHIGYDIPEQLKELSKAKPKDEPAAVEQIKPGAKVATQKRQRQDALAVVLDEILVSMKTRTPAKVMAELRKQIGKQNICILRNVGDGIEWENDRGEVKTLTIILLGERIREWKKTGLSQD